MKKFLKMIKKKKFLIILISALILIIIASNIYFFVELKKFRDKQNNLKSRITEINSSIEDNRNSLKDIEDRIIDLELDKIFKKEEGVIDIYSSSFQTVDENFNILVENIERYGSGTKLSFQILNVSGVQHQNPKFKFKIRNDSYEVIKSKKFTLIGDIYSGWSKNDEVVISEVTPSEIKDIKVIYESGGIKYKSHD